MTDPILDQIVNLTISSSTQSPTRPGFGTALIMASSVPAGWGANLVKSFGSIDEVVAAGFTTTNEARLMAATYFGQNPRPTTLKIAKRTSIPTRRITLTVNATVAIGNVYLLTLAGTTYSYTAVDTLPATVATGLAALVAAPSGFTASAAAGVVTFVAITPGAAPALAATGDVVLLDTTTDPGISANLDAVQAEDGDWYGLLIDVEGAATITSAASWAQAQMKSYIYETFDTGCENNAITNDILSNMTTLAYDHVAGTYSRKATNSRIPSGWMGALFPYDPGTENWAYKTLIGVPVQTFTTSAFNAIDAKRGNVYAKVQGATMTWQGKNHATWIDQTRGIDWLQATVKVNFLSVFLNTNKVPFTDFGGDQLYNSLDATLSGAENGGLLDAARGHVVTVPKIATFTASQRNLRKWTGIKFTAYLAGAVNSVQINGNITP